MLFLLLLLNYHITGAFSNLHQTGENPPSDTVSDCPSKRSVFGIVWGCLSTALICAWVSVHPNIPSPKDYGLVLRWRRIRLMLWTLVAPELILAWAFRQHSAAKDIAERYNKRHFGDKTLDWLRWWRETVGWLKGRKPVASKYWSTTHGHFLVMGGIILVPLGSGNRLGMPTSPNNNSPPADLDSLYDSAPVVTYQMFKELIATHNGIRILEAEIDGRSKGDIVSKLIAVFQTLWFILQCIARRRQHLAITELELLVGALASLNLFMYCCWMGKPLDVSSEARIGICVADDIRTPLLSLKQEELPVPRLQEEAVLLTVIQEEQLEDQELPVQSLQEAAVLLAATQGPPSRTFQAVTVVHGEMKRKISSILQHPLILPITFFTLLPFYLFILIFFPIFAFFPLSIIFLLRITTVKADQPILRGYGRGIYAMNMVKFSLAGLSSLSSSIRGYVERCLNKLLRIDSYVILFFRWFILLPCLFVGLLIVLTALLPLFIFTYFISFAFSSVFEILSSSDNDIPHAATHFPPFYSPKLEDDKYSRIVFAFAGTLFGGLHLFGWTLTYPSKMERIFWITSSLAITIIPGVVAFFDFILTLREEHNSRSIWYRALDFLVALLLFVYILARLCLIGQALALMSVKNQPPDAFDTVDWPRFIFHFS